jgi:hypothetical protein
VTRPKVFVSYSRRDAERVRKLVQLLRAVGTSVFRDEDDIEPGTRWQEEIARSIDEATLLVLFWCAHSQASQYVASEVEIAMADLGKRILPVLLDETPLTPQLAEFQHIDFRDLGCSGDAPEPGKASAAGEPPGAPHAPAPAAPPVARASRTGPLAAVAVVALVLAGLYGFFLTGENKADPGDPGGGAVSPLVLLAALAVALGVLVGVVRIGLRLGRRIRDRNRLRRAQRELARQVERMATDSAAEPSQTG